MNQKDNIEKILKPNGIKDNSSLLYESIKNDAVACFKLILSKEASVLNSQEDDCKINVPDASGKTYLHVIAENSAHKCLDELLKLDINVNARNNEGNTALHILTESYKEKTEKNKCSILCNIKRCISMLIKHPLVDLHAINLLKVEILSAMSKDETLKKMLKDQKTKQSTGISSHYWLAKITNAMISNSEISVDDTRELKNSAPKRNDLYIGSLCLLCYAIEKCHRETVAALLDCKVSLANRKCIEKLPLHRAIKRRDYPTIELLLTHMKNEEGKIDLRDDSFTILQVVMETIARSPANEPGERNPMSCLTRFLKEDVLLNVNAAKKNETNNATVTTPLHIAASINSQEAMKLLIMNGAYLLEPYKLDDYDGSYVLSIIQDESLKEAMDGCIKTAPKQRNFDSPIIELNYRFLLPRESETTDMLRATTILNISTKPNYKKFIMHPLLEALLQIKWAAVRPYYLLNNKLNLLFHTCFLIYLLLINFGIYTQQRNNATNATTHENMNLANALTSINSTSLQFQGSNITVNSFYTINVTSPPHDEVNLANFTMPFWYYLSTMFLSIILFLLLPYFISLNIILPIITF